MSQIILEGYQVQIEQPVQWGEQDAFGHVNNMHFIRWFETSRIAYLRAIDVAVTADGIGPILASVSCNFRHQIKYPDTVIVGTRVVKIGRSSLRMEHVLQSETTGLVCADGDSTAVMFDYVNQASSPIGDPIRNKIRELERNPEL